jgi:AAA15 family ATPase/GTPase
MVDKFSIYDTILAILKHISQNILTGISMAFDFEISGFRSFKDAARIKSDKKFLFVIGQNNAGKSNVLAAVSLAYNKTINHNIVEEIKREKLILQFNGSFLYKKSLPHKVHSISLKLNFYFETYKPPTYDDEAESLRRDDLLIYTKLRSILDDVEIDNYYAAFYMNDGNNLNSKLQSVIQKLSYSPPKNGTVFVPTFRHLAKNGHEIPSFLTRHMCGDIQSPHNFINKILDLDRSETNPDGEREKLKKIESFMAYCLECKDIAVQVSNTKNKNISYNRRRFCTRFISFRLRH